MSRALILIAQARFLGRPLTADETTDCLRVWSELAGGERVYVPERLPCEPAVIPQIQAMRESGMAWRAIASKLGIKKDSARRLAQTEP